MEKAYILIPEEINSNDESYSSLKNDENIDDFPNIQKSTQIIKKNVKYKSNEIIRESEEEISISFEQIEKAMTIYRRYVGDKYLKADVNNIDENKIPLKGDPKILCLICKDTHDGEDCQYLIVKDNNKIIFDCICKNKDQSSIILNRRPKRVKITTFPSDDPFYYLIQKNTPKSHSEIFCKIIEGRCFTVINNRTITIWVANKCNLWEKKPKRILLKMIEDMTIDFIKTWTEKTRGIWDDKLEHLNEDNPNEKKLYDEITSLTWLDAVNKFDNRIWTKQIMDYVVTELMDNDREKLMNQTKGEIACPPCHILIVKTGETRERTVEDNWTIELPVPYASKDNLNEEKYEIWKNFIQHLTLGNKEMAHNLRDICGSILLGSGSNGALTVIEGKDNSGKDILLKAIKCLMGDFGAKESKKFIAGKVSNIEALKNVRYLNIPDIEFNDKINNSYIKEILEGGKILVKSSGNEIDEIIPLFPLILTSEDELNLDNKILKKTYIFKLEAKFVDKINPKKSNQFKLNEIFDNIRDDTELLQVVFYWVTKGSQNFTNNGNKIPLDKGRVEVKEKKNTINQFSEDSLESFISEKCWTLQQYKKSQILNRIKIDRSNRDKLNEKVDIEWFRYKEQLDTDRKMLKGKAKEYKYKIRTSEFYKKYKDYCGERGQRAISKSDMEDRMEKLGYGIVIIDGIWNFIDIIYKE
jgi:hypothetical protein